MSSPPPARKCKIFHSLAVYQTAVSTTRQAVVLYQYTQRLQKIIENHSQRLARKTAGKPRPHQALPIPIPTPISKMRWKGTDNM